MNGSTPWTPLSEEELVQISRTTRTCVPTDLTSTSATSLDDQIQQFSSLLDNVLGTSGVAAINGSHRVAAWNTLCSLIDQAIKSDLPELDDALWNLDIWSRVLDIYLGHAQTARPKSSRQLMTSLTKALQKSTVRDLTPVKQTITHRLVHCLLDFQGQSKAKVSAQLLSHLLLKDVTSLENVLGSFEEPRSNTSSSTFEVQVTHTLEILFRWMGRGDFSSTVSQFVSIILDKADASEKLPKSSSRPIWAKPLASAFERGSINLDDLRVHLLPTLFKRSFADFESFLRMQGLESIGAPGAAGRGPEDASQELLYAALQAGKEMGLLHETEEPSIVRESNILLVPVKTIGLLLRQSSRAARLTGLSLLTTSHTATRPVPLSALTLIRQSLDLLFADVDADFRSGVFSALQRLIDRIRAITAVLARQVDQQKNIAAPSGNQHIGHTLQYHKTFLKHFLAFLSWELRPTASYQRHISALKCISFMARSGLDEFIPTDCLSKAALGETKWPFHMRVVTEDLQRLLLDLLLDPFDDVRQASASILGFYSSTAAASQLLSQECLALTLGRAEAVMLATGRADHADGVAHIYALCYRRCGGHDTTHDPAWTSRKTFLNALIDKLDRMVQLAQDSLSSAVQRYPLHGLLTSLRYILSQDPKSADADLKSRLLEYLIQIWNIVKPILCDDAPEGFVPDALETMSSGSTKETLSYSWRALKEASLLLSSLVSTSGAGNDPILTEQMSNLCFIQLAELRHRGAFSTVAQTWTSCCMECQNLKEAGSGSPMLEVWYGKVLDMLKNNVTINTRRSAGLPSLLCGILIADQTGRLLIRAFADLENIARQAVSSKSAEEGSLAQVHAMNCIKDILKATRLGERTQQYVPTALQLAADALRSEVWGVRNCGLMLFRAVIDRLLGTNEAHLEDDVIAQKRISAEQHPALLDVLLGLLPHQSSSAATASTRYEGVFPALQLLKYTQIPELRLAETMDAVAGLTASPSWHVRDKAARTLASLVSVETVHANLDVLLRNIPTDQNRMHGSLLTAKYIISQIRHTSGDATASTVLEDADLESGEIWLQHMYAVTNILNSTPSYVVKAACIDVVSSILELIVHASPTSDLSIFHDFNADFDISSDHSSGAVLRQAWARYAAHRIQLGRFDDQSEPLDLFDKVLDLAERDPDAAAYFFEAVDWSLAKASCSPQCDDDCGVKIGWFCVDLMAKNTFDVRLKSLAQKTLLSLQSGDREMLQAKRVGDLLDAETSACLNDSRHDQGSVDQLFFLRALQLEETITAATPDAVSKWALAVTAAIKENGIHTREVGATALSQIHNLWKRLPLPIWTDLCLAVYDLLNDDDEDVRLLAAGIASRILTTSNPSPTPSTKILEPIAASQQLLAVLHKRCTTSNEATSHLTSIVFSHAFNLSTTTTTPSVADQLAALSHPDTALFAEEKQNLYLDDAREVRIWAKYLQRLPAPCFSEQHFAAFTNWVIDGLTHLSSTTDGKVDGPLGLSTKGEDVFTLGLRVVLGVEVLFGWVAKGVRLSVRPSDLRMKVFECVKGWEEGKVNCLWREELERVLGEAVLGKTKAVDGVARFVAGVEGRKLI